MALTTMQNTFAGINPNWAVRIPITQMIPLFTIANAQPSQQRRPTSIVDATVNTHDR
jgi:hypothetical protein